ncbi:MAG: hypothetical protein QG638_2567, partial [Pseudomonadota bacterium]|nr:hypothetical protein [Pseudomonadota bacterium]
PMPMDVISPISTMQLTAGDGEAMHIKPGSKQDVEAGTYNRLQLGAAVVRNDKGELPLPPMQPVFGSKLGVPLLPIAFLPISLVKLQPVLTTNLFAPTLSTTTLTTDLKTISPTLTTSILTSSTLTSPTLATKTITAPLQTTTLGTAPLVGTTSPTISPALTPTYSLISPTIIMTAAIKPPPPPPPPPPKVITCKTCLFIKR